MYTINNHNNLPGFDKMQSDGNGKKNSLQN